MNNKYFDSWKFKQAFELMEVDPLTTKMLYEKYLQKYPKDYCAYPYYCSILIILGELELAEKVLKYAEVECNKDEKFKQTDRMKRYDDKMFYTKLKLLSYQGKKEELYKFCIDNIGQIRNKNMNSILFYAKKITGRLSQEKRDVNSYLFKQMVRYEERDFLNHIKKHLYDYNEDVFYPNENIFENNFPIKKIVEEIKKYVPSDKKMYWGVYDDVYFFKYNGCGRANNKLVDYFKVICIHNTSDMITMFPVSANENLPHIDLNYLIDYNQSNKVKKLSQIDKFNHKYKNN